MRFQSIYVDMRPILAKWLGFSVVILSIFLIMVSIRPDFEYTLNQLIRIYEQQHEAVGKGKGIEFWTTCVQSAPCWKSLIFSWKAPLLVKSLLVSSVIFGLVSAFYGMYWRPEVMANRDIRVNSAKIEESRQSSPIPPRGVL